MCVWSRSIRLPSSKYISLQYFLISYPSLFFFLLFSIAYHYSLAFLVFHIRITCYASSCILSYSYIMNVSFTNIYDFLTTFWVAHATQPQVKLWLVNNILKRACMEAIVAHLRHYSGVYLKCLRKTTKTVMTGGPQVCISSLDFQTMKLDVRTRTS